MVSPLTHVPEIAGVLLLVAGVPATAGALSVVGIPVSMITGRVGERGELFPSGSLSA